MPRSTTELKESTPQTLCTNLTDESTTLNAKDIFAQETRKSIERSITASAENEELIFVLMKPNQKVNKSTKLTMGKWCDKHDILWYNIETLKELVDYVSDTRRN